MPNVVKFYKIGQTSETTCQDIDAELCAYLEVPVDPEKWCCDWYNWLALFSAMGKSYEEIKACSVRDKWWVTKEAMAAGHKIIDWFAENYTVNSWYERK